MTNADLWTYAVVLGLYLLLMAGTGVYFSRRQTSTSAYFTAGRSISGWVMGLSLFATVVSSVSFIAYPGAGYAGRWQDSVVPVLGSPLLLIPVILVLIPMYRELISISVYEYIERRFDRVARVYSTISFFLANFAKLAFVFYLVALTVNTMTGWNIYTVTVIVGVVTVFYTIMGGIEAVIWTDVIQGIILWVGGIFALGYILVIAPHGPGEIFQYAVANHRFDFGSTGLTVAKPTLLIMLCLGFYEGLQKYAGDQTIVQRFLVTTTGREAGKGAIIGIVVTILCAVFFTFIGTCLWSFYHLPGNVLPADIAAGKAENVFPYFLQTRVPAVLTAVVLAALMSAAMSTVSSVLNGFGAVGVEDYYRLLRPAATDRERLTVGRIIICVAGVLCIGLSLFLIPSKGTAMALWWVVAPIVSAGIVGLFFLALVSTRTNRQGVYAGIAAATGFTAWATFTLDANHAFDLGFLATPIHGSVTGIISGLLFVIVGYGVSFLFPDNSPDKQALTYWGWRARRRSDSS